MWSVARARSRPLSPRLGSPRLASRSCAAVVLAAAIVAALALSTRVPAQEHEHAAAEPHRMTRSMPMLVGMEGARPPVTPFLPGAGVNPATLLEAKPRETLQLRDGDTLDLAAMLVRRTLNGKQFTMYGFNGQYPGPLLAVSESSTVIVRFANRIDLPSSVHWHGVRLENRFDGAVGVTQEAVPPGGTFTYRVHFPDAGIYWYHPHVREDIQQDMGLYGNMLVAPSSTRAGFYNPVHREEVVVLDDIVVENDSLVPYGRERSNYTLMGRFGTVMLVNGEPRYTLRVSREEVIRFFITNVASTRIFNVSFGGAPIKVIGSDVSRFEREEMASSVVLAPAERAIVEVHFKDSGTLRFTNRVQALDHFNGEFFPQTDTLGAIEVSESPVERDVGATFVSLREHPEVIAEIDRFRPHFARPPDHELVLTLAVKDLPIPLTQFFTIDTAYFRPVEWSDAMPDMNWVTSGHQIRWILRDRATGRENMDIHWRFKQGDIVKIRVVNDARSFHPMSHPIHLHGQRFLVVARDGVRVRNLVWKDTFLVPVGATVDIVVDASNPGTWMTHCHIAEHLEAGMMALFTVAPN